MSEKTLTPADPVPPEVLKKLSELVKVRAQLAERNLQLDSEKVHIQRLTGQVEAQKTKMFEGILMERGLSPSLPVEIDSSTGMLIIKDPPVAEAEPEPAEESAVEAPAAPPA
jgi:hypothetical protein